MDIRGLGYIGITAEAIDEWRPYSEMLGAMVSDDGAELRLRFDERPYRLLVGAGPDGLAFAGWELPDSDALECAVAELTAAEITTHRAPVDECEHRRVRGLVRATDPGGFTLELFHGPILDHELFVSPTGVSGITTGAHGMGHIVLGTPTLEASVDFYTNVLGFRVSGIEPAPKRSEVTWSQLLHSQAAVACDFFTLDTAVLRRYYVLIFIHIPTRQVFYAAATANPTGTWTTQAARNLFLRHGDQLTPTRALLRDRGSQFIDTFAERWIGSIRRELLDRTVIWNPKARTARCRLQRPLQRAPIPPLTRPATTGGEAPPPVRGHHLRVVKWSRCDGLIDEYRHAA